MQSCYTIIEFPKNVEIMTSFGIPKFSEFHKNFGSARFGFSNSDSEPYFGIPQTPSLLFYRFKSDSSNSLFFAGLSSDSNLYF